MIKKISGYLLIILLGTTSSVVTHPNDEEEQPAQRTKKRRSNRRKNKYNKRCNVKEINKTLKDMRNFYNSEKEKESPLYELNLETFSEVLDLQKNGSSKY
ncbi:hypothetical protein FJ366_03090 [Candidatus Dependentiae bacterium]|nr:hypothetical protein [Candidatus Dependentiae bacterium]